MLYFFLIAAYEFVVNRLELGIFAAVIITILTAFESSDSVILLRSKLFEPEAKLVFISVN